MTENADEITNPLRGLESNKEDAAVKEDTVEQDPAAVERLSSKSNSVEGLVSELEDSLKKQQGLEAILGKLEAAVNGDDTVNVTSSYKETPAQENPAQVEDNSQLNKGSDQGIPGLVFMLIKMIEKVLDTVIDVIDTVLRGGNESNRPNVIGGGGSDYQEQNSKDENASSPQMHIEQVATSDISDNRRSTSSLSDSKTSEEAHEGDKPKGSMEERIESIIGSCKNDPERLKIVEDFLEKGKENLGVEELKNFNDFKKMVDEEFVKQGIERTAPQNQAKEQSATPSLNEGVEGSVEEEGLAKEGVTKEKVQKKEVALSLNDVVPGPKEGEKEAPGKIELGELPGMEEVTKDLAAVGVTSSDLGNSSSAPAPAAREGGGR